MSAFWNPTSDLARVVVVVMVVVVMVVLVVVGGCRKMGRKKTRWRSSLELSTLMFR